MTAPARIWWIIPRPIKHALRNGLDKLELLFRRGVDEFTPPESLVQAVGGRFEKSGQEFFRYFLELGSLKPDEKVLDVGSGCGRMAVPLTRYLDATGRYEGFDIAPPGINWCRKTISPKHPNFHFQLADVYDDLSNPRGKYAAAKYRFPYDDSSFDFIFLTSVFTHLLPEEVDNYLAEIGRVLKEEGRVLATFFLLNNQSEQLIEERLGIYNFEHRLSGYRTIDPVHPRAAVAHPEGLIRSLFQTHDLRITEPIHYGSWCGRPSYLSFQDIILATRPG